MENNELYEKVMRLLMAINTESAKRVFSVGNIEVMHTEEAGETLTQIYVEPRSIAIKLQCIGDVDYPLCRLYIDEDDSCVTAEQYDLLKETMLSVEGIVKEAKYNYILDTLMNE